VAQASRLCFFFHRQDAGATDDSAADLSLAPTPRSTHPKNVGAGLKPAPTAPDKPEVCRIMTFPSCSLGRMGNGENEDQIDFPLFPFSPFTPASQSAAWERDGAWGPPFHLCKPRFLPYISLH